MTASITYIFPDRHTNAIKCTHVCPYVSICMETTTKKCQLVHWHVKWAIGYKRLQFTKLYSLLIPAVKEKTCSSLDNINQISVDNFGSSSFHVDSPIKFSKAGSPQFLWIPCLQHIIDLESQPSKSPNTFPWVLCCILIHALATAAIWYCRPTMIDHDC